MPGVRRRAALLGCLAAAALTACGRIISPAPPPSPPSVSQLVTVAGTPIVVAARAARILQQISFSTKRFSSDSLWAFRSGDSIHVRMRYAQPSRDSTRALVEYWGTCRSGGTGCMLGLHSAFVEALNTDEPPPP